jgi:copper resistance protein B
MRRGLLRGLLGLALLLAGLFCSAQFAVAQDHSQHQQRSAEPVPMHAPDPQPSAREPTPTPTQSELRHVPPDPPQHAMDAMSNEQMIELMQMDDAASLGMVMLDQFEWRRTDRREQLGLEAEAWYGNDYHKLWLKAEGQIASGQYEGRTELLWGRVLSRWFELQLGIRRDFEAGPARSWLALGIQGLGAHWLEFEATAYVGEDGRTAVRFSGTYELLLTQRLILQPELDVEIYGRDDARNGIGAGLAQSELALRLRYEIRRELAPYVGVIWSERYGETADFARAEGLRKGEVQFTVGVRVWF